MRQFLYCLGAICILIGGSLILPPVGFALPVAVTINLDEDTPTQSLPPNATQGTLGICEGPLSGNVCANGLSDAVLFEFLLNRIWPDWFPIDPRRVSYPRQ